NVRVGDRRSGGRVLHNAGDRRFRLRGLRGRGLPECDAASKRRRKDHARHGFSSFDASAGTSTEVAAPLRTSTSTARLLAVIRYLPGRSASISKAPDASGTATCTPSSPVSATEISLG